MKLNRALRSFKTIMTRRKVIILIVVSWLISLCVLIFSIYVFLPWIVRPQERSTFCTSDDEVYQAIPANLDTWLHYFPEDDPVVSSPEQTTLRFTVASGKKYSVRSNVWTYTKTTRVFLVTADYGGPSTPAIGLRGYLYTASGKLPDLSTSYATANLSPNLYCFWIKGDDLPPAK